jgi:para-aminobenzoate synthetase
MAQEHRTRHTPSFNTALPLPLYLRSLTTSYKRGLPNLIPDIPSLSPVADIQSWKWEQRSVLVGEIGAMPQDVFERFTKGSNPLGEIWLDSARVSPSSLDRLA